MARLLEYVIGKVNKDDVETKKYYLSEIGSAKHMLPIGTELKRLDELTFVVKGGSDELQLSYWDWLTKEPFPMSNQITFELLSNINFIAGDNYNSDVTVTHNVTDNTAALTVIVSKRYIALMRSQFKQYEGVIMSVVEDAIIKYISSINNFKVINKTLTILPVFSEEVYYINIK